MESQLHRTQDPHSYESLNPTGSNVHDEYEHGAETKSTMKKMKEKLKATLKHGHGHGHHDDSVTVDDSPAVMCGLVEPTVTEKPVLVEDLYATHSDIVDPPVRSFAQWEEEERRGAPPPLSTTGIYATQLTDPSSQVGYGQDVNREQWKGNIGKSNVMENPTHNQSRVADPTSTGAKEAGITDVLRSFDKMKVFDQPESKTSKSDQNKPTIYSGSHDQFAPEPILNPPLDTPDTIPGDQLGSSNESESKPSTIKKSSFATGYTHKVADTLSGTLGPVYEKVKTKILTEPGSKGVGVKEYLVETFMPGEDDKVLSGVITQAFNRRKPSGDTDTTIITNDEGERRLQDSGN